MSVWMVLVSIPFFCCCLFSVLAGDENLELLFSSVFELAGCALKDCVKLKVGVICVGSFLVS